MKCAARVLDSSGWHYHSCAKPPLKGKAHCAIHDPERVAAKEQARGEARRAREKEQDDIQREGKELARDLGLNASALFHRGYGSERSGYVRQLAISFEDAERLAQRLNDHG